jgi:uncharacterized membrane protein (UPF0127 family)
MILLTRDGTEISSSARLVVSRLDQMRGLMFARHKDLVFDLKRVKSVWIHMMFVFHPIDIVLLDSRRNIAGLKNHFRPFRWWFPGVKARFILELPAGTIDRFGLRFGDCLDLGEAGGDAPD